MPTLKTWTDTQTALVNSYVEEHNLIVVSSKNECDGRITWKRGGQQSSKDDSPLTEGARERLTIMKIDEIGAYSLGSDHKRITLTFGKMKSRNPKTLADDLKLNDQQLANIANGLEAEIEKQPTKDCGYSKLIDFI